MSDPNYLTYLSPRHFLTGAPLTSFPEPNLSVLSVACLGCSACKGANNCLGRGGPQTVLTVSNKEANGLHSAESASKCGCLGQGQQSSTTGLEDGNGGGVTS